MSKKPSLFDFLKLINEDKENILSLDPSTQSAYNPFIINRGLSMHIDTVMSAQVMNYYHELPKDMQMEYHIKAIPKGRRFAKWAKEGKEEYLDTVISVFECSKMKALELLDILPESELARIHRTYTDRGGIQRRA